MIVYIWINYNDLTAMLVGMMVRITALKRREISTSRRGHAFLVGLFLPAPGRSVAKHFGSMFGF